MTFASNRASDTGQGGGLYSRGESLTVNTSTFRGNSAGTVGGGGTGEGGAIFISADSAARISRCTFNETTRAERSVVQFLPKAVAELRWS